MFALLGVVAAPLLLLRGTQADPTTESVDASAVAPPVDRQTQPSRVVIPPEAEGPPGQTPRSEDVPETETRQEREEWAQRPVWQVDFDGLTPGDLRNEDLPGLFGTVPNAEDKDLSNFQIAEDPEDPKERVLRVIMPKNEYGGGLWQVTLPGEYERACLSFRVRFSPDYGWSHGGKLPGLAGSTAGGEMSDASGADGAPEGDDAWSARMKWKEDGAAISYLYYPDQQRDHGDNLFWDRAFERGTWHDVSTCIEMNEPGKADGSLTTFFDGEPALREDGILFRTTRKLAINTVFFSAFRGGQGSRFHSKYDGYVDYDDFSVHIDAGGDATED